MLPTNFAVSRVNYPGLASAFDALEGWIKDHPDLSYLEIDQFRRARPDVGLAQLAVALSALVEDGVFNEEFAVVAPTNGALALTEDASRTGFYESEEEIPDELYDTALTSFPTDEGELIPVYREPVHG